MREEFFFNDTALLPQHDYVYAVSGMIDGWETPLLAETQIHTMDTTSHDYCGITSEMDPIVPNLILKINDMKEVEEIPFLPGSNFAEDIWTQTGFPIYAAGTWGGLATN